MWSKSNVIQTYDDAKVTIFARFESESAWRRPLVLPLRSRSSKFLQAHRLNTRSNDSEGEDLFLWPTRSFKCMIVVLPMFWRSAPALKFSWHPTRYVSLVTMLVYSYRQSPNEDERSLWVGILRSSFTAVLLAAWSYFSPRRPRQQFPLPANLHHHSVALTFN